MRRSGPAGLDRTNRKPALAPVRGPVRSDNTVKVPTVDVWFVERNKGDRIKVFTHGRFCLTTYHKDHRKTQNTKGKIRTLPNFAQPSQGDGPYPPLLRLPPTHHPCRPQSVPFLCTRRPQPGRPEVHSYPMEARYPVPLHYFLLLAICLLRFMYAHWELLEQHDLGCVRMEVRIECTTKCLVCFLMKMLRLSGAGKLSEIWLMKFIGSFVEFRYMYWWPESFLGVLIYGFRWSTLIPFLWFQRNLIVIDWLFQALLILIVWSDPHWLK